jgi:glycosyltransferase involved in cell wall biosynthesis
MSKHESNATSSRSGLRLGLVTTFPPTHCGIARFSSSLGAALTRTAPEIELDIVRLVDGIERPSTRPVAMEVDPNSRVGIRATARHLNRADVVLIQHEYGIYGADDGIAVLALVESTQRPVISILHTVVARPSRNQRRIIETLSQSSTLVVLSESARAVLASEYAVVPDRVVVIPHGAQWRAHPPGPAPRSELITWGLLGPGKGLERSIRALPFLEGIFPLPRYRIVGRTHPAVFRAAGLGYKRQLEDLVAELGVGHMVEFVDRYLADDELEGMVAASDIVILPYDNDEQVSSGVLTDAVGAGRPVVATRFPHAVELLGAGAGIVVPHDSRSIAAGVRRLLLDHEAYHQAAAAAAAGSQSLTWDAAAESLVGLVRELARHQATA